MLFFVVIPLVFASLANGVLQLGELTHLGPLAGRTFTLFFANMLIAVSLGLVMMNALQPGGRLDDETSTRLVQEYSGQAQKHVETSAARPGISPAVRRGHVHAAQSLRRVRRQPAQRARRRAAADPVRDPGRCRGPRVAEGTARSIAARTRDRQRADDRHRALRVAARALRGACDDLQRDRQGRLRHHRGARAVRGRVPVHAAVAPLRHDVAVAQVSSRSAAPRSSSATSRRC